MTRLVLQCLTLSPSAMKELQKSQIRAGVYKKALMRREEEMKQLQAKIRQLMAHNRRLETTCESWRKTSCHLNDYIGLLETGIPEARLKVIR